MYKSLTSDDYRKHLKLPDGYTIDGFMVYGTYKKHPFEQFEASLKKLGYSYKKSRLEHDFFGSLVEFEVQGKRYWMAVAYGGALLSEYLHLACLFGSRQNILLGSCGGLKKGAATMDIVVPEWSFASESSAKAYQADTDDRYPASVGLSNLLADALSKHHTVHRGATITFQAMMAETWEDIQAWSEDGFIAVEMEASTVFAVSNHFKVPSAAILMIGDNLIEEQTVMDINYENGREARRHVAQNAFDISVKVLIS